MDQGKLFDILYGMLSVKGRERALLGDDKVGAGRAYARMAPECGRANVYFELPLLGEPRLDVHCSVSDATRHAPAPRGGDASWLAALSWFAGLEGIDAAHGDVLLMAEADASDGPDARPGIYLIHQDRADLVAPFLEAVGETPKLAAWNELRGRLPRGWQTSYVGLFPSRPGGLLRVNAHPADDRAVGLDEALGAWGLAAGDGALRLCHELLSAGGLGFDLQLDVDDKGVACRDFGLEVYLEGQAKTASAPKDRAARRAFRLLEACGAADGRWRHLEGVDLSRRIALPYDGGMASCAVSIRLFSAKVKFVDGRPHLAKAYLRGDALL